jgi:hypothetical protein
MWVRSVSCQSLLLCVVLTQPVLLVLPNLQQPAAGALQQL